MSYTHRTQIILPEKLRKDIARARARSGESLGSYLRTAVRERLSRERTRKTNLRSLAGQVVGAAPDPALIRAKVSVWQRASRRDRR